MKNFNTKKLSQLLLILMLWFVIGSSCKNNDEITTDYIGTWMADESIPSPIGDIQVRDMLTFTIDGFSHQFQIPDETPDVWIDYATMKGLLSVSGSSMNITITEVGTSIDMATGKPTGTITTYKEGSMILNMLLDQIGQSKTFKSEFSISGKKLTIKTDINNDGDFLDENETVVYTRQ